MLTVLVLFIGDVLLIYGCLLILWRKVIMPKIEKEIDRRTERLIKLAKDNSGKAPLSGKNTQQQRDNKATATGKAVDPNRPHVDKDK